MCGSALQSILYPAIILLCGGVSCFLVGYFYGRESASLSLLKQIAKEQR